MLLLLTNQKTKVVDPIESAFRLTYFLCNEGAISLSFTQENPVGLALNLL